MSDTELAKILRATGSQSNAQPVDEAFRRRQRPTAAATKGRVAPDFCPWHAPAASSGRIVSRGILLLTLPGRGELALAKWSEFDFQRRTWTIPDSHARTGRVCGAHDHVALHPAAAGYL
jgi:hypothetical protein